MTRRFIYGNGRIGLEAEKGEVKGFWSLYADALGSTEEAREWICISRRLVNIVYGMLKNHTEYREPER